MENVKCHGDDKADSQALATTDDDENDDSDCDDGSYEAVRKAKDASGLRRNPSEASFWQRRAGGDIGKGDADKVNLDGDPGGRTPQSLAQDQWEELPLIKEGILGKV